MQSQTYVQLSQGLTPYVVAAALLVGVIGGYAFRATAIQLAPAAATTEAGDAAGTVLIPRSVREGEAASNVLIPRSVREGEASMAPQLELDPAITR